MMRNGVRDILGSPKPKRIVVVGERGTGKSSLIAAAVDGGAIYPNLPPVLPRINLPSEYFFERVPATIIDTSSRPEHRAEVIEEVKKADAIVLTFACERPETLGRLYAYWLPLFRQLELRVPVIVAGYKFVFELGFNQIDITEITSPMMREYREIEVSFKWSGQMLYDIPWRAQEIIMHAHEAAIHPLGPIYDLGTNAFKPRCMAALRRVFLLSSHNRDSVLTNADINYLQMKCFHESVLPHQYEELRGIVLERCPFGVNERGITWDGFLRLNLNLVEGGRVRDVWIILRKFGYNNELRLRDDMIPYQSFRREADQSVELSNTAIGFLSEVYEFLDQDGDNNVESRGMRYLFQAAPECPFDEAVYKNAIEVTNDGGLTLEAFFSLWSLITLTDPARALECLICIIYPHDPSLAVTVTRRRSLDLKEQKCERKVVQCFVFGPKNAGKSALLNRFIGRSYDNDNNGSTEDRYAVNMVSYSGMNKVLVLKEIQIQEDGLSLSNGALAACDVAIFVYDSSDESSWKKSVEMLSEVATISKEAGFVFPCLMVAAKCDLVPFPRAIQKSTKVTKEMGIRNPIQISSKLRGFDGLFEKIVIAAGLPHMSIPEIKPKKKESSNSILMALSIGAGALIFGLASFRLYAARKQRKFLG